MPDLYRDIPCLGCGKLHTLFDTSALRHPPGDKYSYICPATRLEATVLLLSRGEVVKVVPDGAVPMEWVSG
jgi:hypothetical protein